MTWRTFQKCFVFLLCRRCGKGGGVRSGKGPGLCTLYFGNREGVVPRRGGGVEYRGAVRGVFAENSVGAKFFFSGPKFPPRGED